MSDSARSPLGALVKLAATIVVAGALVAAMLLPWVGGTGLAARNSASLLDALPVELTDETPNGNATMVAADGQPITQFYDNNRTPVTHDQISDVMKQAIVDIEDSRFYQHNGLDVEGTARALAKNVAAGAVLEGGSTLTQQLVKQTLLQTADNAEERAAAEEESVGRKLKEARLALALEEEYSKDEILTRYLNIAYFGQGAYGIQAAAQKYFSVNAIDLTLPQASVLAGLVQSPKFDPISYPAEATERRNQVLNRMHQLGHITDQELADTTAAPIPLAPGGNAPNGCIDAAIGGFFCDYVMSYLTQALGLSMDDIKDNGWTIQTTLRPDMQVAGDQAVLATQGMGDPIVGVYDAIEPGTGHVMAMSVNRRFGCGDPAAGCESVNFATIPTKGSGSTFKTFVAAAALEQGLPASHTITTSEPYRSRVYQGFNTDTAEYEPYEVENVGNNYPNTLTMTQALYMSSNTYFLALEDALGRIEPAVRMAERLGMNFDYSVTQTPAQKIIDENRPSFAFGTDGVSPLDLANAYATIAASGVKCAPKPVLQIVDRNGEPVTDDEGQPVVPGDQCEQVVEPGLANTLAQMLRKDVEPGNPMQTGARAYVPGHQIAGKTGTVNNNDSVTFVGFTPEYAASVMVFRPTGIDSVGGYGGGRPATIWHDAMLPILSGQPTAAFPAADPKYAGSGVDAPPTSARPSSSSSSSNDGDDRESRRWNRSSSRDTSPASSPAPAPAPVVEPAPSTAAAPTTEAAPPADPAAPQPDLNGDGQPG
ncbi:transglycosylase domain-containing protein [Modestobacter marinus]|uniref:Membrane peptidoglycan carboxypeptidase n=1 Tax=Modestobacter marinus TaxID=477641 RepID=A0A846LDN2_9ACTN|nr:transglycosylase domain-containing protein [Modestobacter marinus]NIH66233.1 membrane peptidoglycan carboxypeptidase [Modestobacter marinus]GGL62062.1 penicillin-binding protein [Modestobacter marinus]